MPGQPAPSQVVIIGGGFGGLFAARALRGGPFSVTLVDRTTQHVFQPLLYQCATGILSEGQITAPLRRLLRRHRNLGCVTAEAADIDPAGRTVTCLRPLGDPVTIPYDRLIVAAGVRQSYFGHDEFAQWAPGMKTIGDALTIRRRVFGAFEMAETAADPGERRRWLTFALVGAGPTGVELAGQIRELATKTLSDEYRQVNPRDARVLLFDGGPAPLATFGRQLSGKAARTLRELGVELHMRSIVTSADAGGLVARDRDGNETRYDAKTVLWTAGVEAPPFAAALARATGAERDRAGRIMVRDDLTIAGYPEISVVGDMMSLRKLPAVAEVAMQSGLYAGRRVRRELTDGATAGPAGRAKPFRYLDLGSAAYISRGRAVVSAGPLRLSGFPGWVAWLFVHIAFLTGYRNRVGAILTWWVAFTRDIRRERAYTTREAGHVRDIYAPVSDAAGRCQRGAQRIAAGRVTRPAQRHAEGTRMSTDQVLTGLALIVVLAVGSQLLASRLRVPALIVLLPVGFTAGAVTTDVNPEKLLGPAFQPLVSLSVAVILYDAGLGLDVRNLTGHTRRVVVRLIALGTPVTWLAGAASAALVLGMSGGAAMELGAILVVSGPTVVAPLLAFVRPAERLRRVLAWEGSLIDPVGATLGAVVFHAVLAGSRRHPGAQIAQFLASVGVGIAGAVAGTALLWLLLGKLRLGEVLGTSTQLAVVVAVAAACDMARDDSGLIAAIVIGVCLTNMRAVDIPARRPFFETLVQLVIGLLFISIPATVTPASLRHLILPALGLSAILVLVVRPLVALLSTRGTDLSTGERRFVGWMAPRGIVAAATASTFSASLVAGGVGGASKILPVTFVVIVATVAAYGLTAVPVARRLGVIGARGARPLLVGGDPWVVELAATLRSTGLDVLIWAGLAQQRERIRQAGLELAPGELLASATGSGAELEGISSVLLLTGEDDFNALASTILQATAAHQVYRLAPPDRSHGVVAPFTAGDVLFGPGLTRPEIIRRQESGARIIATPAGQPHDGYDLLFVIRQDGGLEPVTAKRRPGRRPGDTSVLLGPVNSAAPASSVQTAARQTTTLDNSNTIVKIQYC